MTVAPDVHLADCEHAVEFYTRDEDLVDVVVGHLATPLRDGDAVVVIATEAHRDTFRAGLAAVDVDVAAAVADGRLVLLDAAETLSGFMIGGQLDAAAFNATVASVVREAANRGRQVRAYGEMVALLWEVGDVTGAIELERLWNALSNEASFSLLCAYPFELISDPDTADAFSEMCALHRRVLSGAPAPPEADVTRRFARNTAGPRLARRFVTDVLMEWDRWDLIGDCLLVVSELATNAVRHADSDFTVSISHWNGGVTLMVGDASVDPPLKRDPDTTAAGGRGLYLINESADRWGHFPAGVGKLVWAHVAPAGESKAVQR